MPHDNANEVADKIFESLLSGYQIGLETSMRGSDFIFDPVQSLYSNCHKLLSQVKLGGSCIINTDWIKKKKTTVNPKNDDYKCFQIVKKFKKTHNGFQMFNDL